MAPSAESDPHSGSTQETTEKSSNYSLSNSLKLTNGSVASYPIAPSLDNSIAALDQNLIGRLFSPSVEAKIWGIASKALKQPAPPHLYPEYTEPGGSEYVYRELDFWTSGFFPGSLYALLERRRRYPHLFPADAIKPHDMQLEFACKWWTENLHQNGHLKGTHDLGFMMEPWARRAWELDGDVRALASLKQAAQTLVARFSPTHGLLRSWDVCQTKKYDFRDTNSEFLVVIDNMMNLSLLFFVAQHTNDTAMRDAAIQHARTTAKTHVRPDASTTHLVVLEPATGKPRSYLTNQGFSHTSCWSRGQAWAIAGFAETYAWTQESEFLDTARRCADYFLSRMPPGKDAVAPWDFDAPRPGANGTDGEACPPDTSATIIAAYGMLLIHRALAAKGERSHYLAAALRLAGAVCARHMNPEAKFVAGLEAMVETVEHGPVQSSSGVDVDMGHGETILNGATINNYEFAPRRWADHGLVYADYYFILFGNELLKMSLGSILGQLGV